MAPNCQPVEGTEHFGGGFLVSTEYTYSQIATLGLTQNTVLSTNNELINPIPYLLLELISPTSSYTGSSKTRPFLMLPPV